MDTKKWEKGISQSLRFYGSKATRKEKQFNSMFPLDEYFGEMIGDKKEVSIADLGAGLFSTTGSTWDTAKVHLYPSDILADKYRELLKERNILPVIPVERQDMTCLTYKSSSFDIVHCVNSLDHCSDPEKALREMHRICSPGGWIYLRHYSNNGEYEQYNGFHLWNIEETRIGCLIWNPVEHFYLDDCIQGFHTSFETDPNGREMIILKLRK